MQQTTFKATFKTVRSGAREGEKRSDIDVPYTALEAADIDNLDHEQVAKVLNQNIIDFGKRQLTENSDDWDFVPQGLDWNSFYEDFSKPSARGNRILSKEKLTALAAAYEKFAQETLKKSADVAATGAKVIQSKFSLISGNEQAKTVMAQNLANMEVEESLQPAFDALMAILAELMETSITADSL